MDFNLWAVAICQLPPAHDGPHNDLNETIWVDVDYDTWERWRHIRGMHTSKHGENDHGPYTICDYDKTDWPCKTVQILQGIV